MAVILLKLSVLLVTVIQLTSSQSTYDVIQEENDVDSCERTYQVLDQLATAVSQIERARGQNEVDGKKNGQVLSQLMTAVSEVRRDFDVIQEEMNISSCERSEQVLSQLVTAESQSQSDVRRLVTANAELQSTVSQLQIANAQLQRDVAELKNAAGLTTVNGKPNDYDHGRNICLA